MPKLTVSHKYKNKRFSGTIFRGDALAFLQSLKPGSADIIFLDPPFNLGKWYGTDDTLDRRPQDEYDQWMKTVLNESVRVLRHGGHLSFSTFLCRTALIALVCWLHSP